MKRSDMVKSFTAFLFTHACNKEPLNAELILKYLEDAGMAPPQTPEPQIAWVRKWDSEQTPWPGEGGGKVPRLPTKDGIKRLRKRFAEAKSVAETERAAVKRIRAKLRRIKAGKSE